MRAFDLVVIGSGPAGEKGAAQAAYFGKSVAMIESADKLGGAGINTGTIPSKTLRETALYFSGLKHRGLYGVDYAKKDLVVDDLMYRKHDVVHALGALVEKNIDKHRITLIRGHASFVDPHVLDINGTERIRGEIILIATGSKPRPSPVDDPRIFDSDTILKMKELPIKLAIVGAGVIGCEYATMFAALGIEVTLIDGRDRLLSFLDHEIATNLLDQMRSLGIQVLLSTRIEKINPSKQIEIHLSTGYCLAVDAVLFAAGRRGNTDSLHLDKAGLSADDGGLLKVNSDYQTATPNIYAAGDVIGFPALASISMEQARVAMCHAFDLKYKTAVAPVYPLAVYTIPEVAMAGETVEACLAKGVTGYCVGRSKYSTNSRGQIIGDLTGEIKIIFMRDSRQVIGVHIIGEMASELIHIGLIAIQSKATIYLFIETVFNYPTFGEIYKYAAYDGLAQL